MILADRAAEHAETPHEEGEAACRAGRSCCAFARPGASIAARGLTDPVWFMIADWFAIYLVAKGFNLEETAAGFWVPFLAADLGNFFGGGFSSWLIRRGWPVGRARRLVIVGGGLGVLALIPAAFASGFLVLLACFAVATFSYAAMSTMALSLPADLYQSRAVASVSGMSGTAAGHRHDRRDLPDRHRRRPLLLHPDPARGERHPARRRGRRPRSSSATPPRRAGGWSRSYEAPAGRSSSPERRSSARSSTRRASGASAAASPGRASPTGA